MGIATHSIQQLLDRVASNELVLPEIQRDFVWTKTSVKYLFDSLYRGLPIGAMLVWQAKPSVKVKRFHAATPNKKLSHPSDAFYGYLLDGQQRLTALSRVRDGDDEYPLMFYLWHGAEESGETLDPFHWRTKSIGDSPWYVPVSQVLEEKFKLSDPLGALKQQADYVAERDDNGVLERLQRLRSILVYPLAVIEFETENYNDATQVFIRFNSAGRKLSKADLAAAQLALHTPGVLSDMLSNAQVRWSPQFRFTRPFLVQCLTAVQTGRVDLSASRAPWKDQSPAEVRDAWRRTEKAIDHVIALLTGDLHWDRSAWIPSFNALIPLVVVLAANPVMSVKQRQMARRWLLLAGIRALFSGRGHQTLEPLLRKVHADPTIESLWTSTLKKPLKRLTANDFLTTRRTGPAMSLYVSMLRENDAKDWEKGTKLNGAVLGPGASLQVHHFFPRALLQKHGKESAEINSFANYTLISAATNLNASIEEPFTYMNRIKADAKQLEFQCIPSDRELWRVGRFSDFLAARRVLLASRANEFLGLR